MAFKFIAFATLAVAASAGILKPNPVVYKLAQFSTHLSQSHPAPAAYAAPKAQAWQAAPTTESYWPKYEDSYNHHPKYNYAYDVHDSHTGDLKNQQESRDGDVVKGSYSLIEADGSRRVVHYSADDHHGFNAIVEKQPAKAAPAVAAWTQVASTTEAYHPEPKYEASYNHHPKYNYAYDVHDSHTGDLKNQQESRDGDVVKGSYSLIEADGSRRVVHYSADDHHGFNAIVEKQPAQAVPTTAAPEHVEKVQHVAYVTPIVYQQVAPVAHYSQSVSYSHAAAPQHYHY